MSTSFTKRSESNIQTPPFLSHMLYAEQQALKAKVNLQWTDISINLADAPKKKLITADLQKRQQELDDVIDSLNHIDKKELNQFGSHWVFMLYDHEGNVIYSMNDPKHHFVGLTYNFFWSEPEYQRELSTGKTIHAECFAPHCPLGKITQSVTLPIYTENNSLLCILSYIFNDNVVVDDESKLKLFLLMQQIKDSIAAKRSLRSYTDSLIDGISDCVVIFDGNMDIVQTNKRFSALLGFEKHLLSGTSLYEYLNEASKQSLTEDTPLKQLTFSVNAYDNPITCSVCSIQPLSTGSIHSFHAMLILRPVQQELPSRIFYENRNHFSHIVAKTPEMLRIINLAERISTRPSTVLITGESGTGKELLAQGIHSASGRAGHFVAINCGAIPKELLQSELFGYVSGAFTGAQKGGKIGKFEYAHKGTLFLDEIGEMPMDMQVSLLRFLQDKTVTRLGSSEGNVVDVRIVAATNRDLRKMVNEGKFREDLYYRLGVIEIELPPLRQRADDIIPIALSMVRKLCGENNIDIPIFEESVYEYLKKYNWPGNIRELCNVIERLVFLTQDDLVTADLLPKHMLKMKSVEEAPSLNGNIQDYEELAVKNALAKSNGNISAAAKILGVTRATFYSKMKKYDLCLKM